MAKGKILIVDDEEDVREVIKLHLEQEGYDNLLEAENGEEAIKILRSEDNMIQVGLILCDIRMPKVNGVEAIDFFKKEAPGIPVVVVTGYPDAELAAYLMKKGVKDYLVKPVEKQKLIDTVNKIVAQGKDFEY
ncbi:MAG: response regulator [Nitrospinae bacterium]|nr:response regulator [Nitrospinota bacterium]